MKRTRNLPNALALCTIIAVILSATSCQETTVSSSSNASSSSSSQEDAGSQASGGSSGGNSGGSSGGSSGGGSQHYPGQTCFGNQQDGTGEGFELRSWSFKLAGATSWVPWPTDGSPVNPLQATFMPSAYVASDTFNPDQKLQVRVKIQAQPRPPKGEEYCYGRKFPQSEYAHYYTKVKFNLSLRDISCRPGSGSASQPECTLGERYATRTVGPIAVDSCSNIYDLIPLRNHTDYGTTIEIWDVRTDNACQATGSSYDCGTDETNAPLKSGSCWAGTVQVSTEFTKAFR